MSEQVQADEATTYDVKAVEEKWRPVWDELQPFRADDDSPREKKYALTMFPYPSGDLHMGHAEVFALHDVVARYWWQRGYEVLNPMGFDSFGLPAENAAIRNDEHPATYTKANIAKSIESCQKYAASFDWSRTFNTSDPEYYRWTQWLFARFYERGLAYRKNSPVNWCPQDQTVLANEQVVQGACERCGAEVTKKELTQWYFKITDYAQDALGDVVYVELPSVGTSVEAGAVFGEVEATKSVSELFAPVAGEVVAVNDELEGAPERVNEDCYGEGWICEIRVVAEGELLDAAAYAALIEG